MFEPCQSSETGTSASVSALAGRRKGAMPTYGSGRAVAYSPQLSLLKIVRLGCRIWGVNILHINIHRKIAS